MINTLLHKLRIDKGETINNISISCHITSGTYKEIESGRHMPGLRTAIKIALYFNLDVIDIFSDTGYAKKVRTLHTGYKDLDSILINISSVIGVPVNTLFKQTRKREIAEGRHLFYYYSRKTGKSLNTLSAIFNQGHVTCMHGIKKIEGMKGIDPIITDYCNKLNKRLSWITQK